MKLAMFLIRERPEEREVFTNKSKKIIFILRIPAEVSEFVVNKRINSWYKKK